MIDDSMIDEEPVDAFRPDCTAAERRAAGSCRGASRCFETTLLDLVSELSDSFQDDERAVRLVARLMRKGWIRTSDGLELQISLGQVSDARSGRRRAPRFVPATGG